MQTVTSSIFSIADPAVAMQCFVGAFGALQPPRLNIRAGAQLAAATFFTPLPALAEVAAKFEPRGITPEDSFVFVLGCVPFVRAPPPSL